MTNTGFLKPALLGLACAGLCGAAAAAPMTYQIDPAHTYPTFEADHLGGLSYWRGKFNKTTGTVVYDQEGQSGSVDITVDASSIDFGNDALNTHAKSPDMFDVGQFPTAHYTGKLAGFQNGLPTRIDGELTLHGVTRPLTLTINKFTCKNNPMNQKPVCGADASAQLDRSDFDITFGQPIFDMGVTLRISVEAAPVQN